MLGLFMIANGQFLDEPSSFYGLIAESIETDQK